MHKLFCINSPDGTETVAIDSDDDIISVATMLSEKIIIEFEDKTVKQIVKRDYSFFDKDERSVIIKECEKSLQKHRNEYKAMIFFVLCGYIRQEEILNCDGFFLFRLKEYAACIENCVDDAVNDYLLKIESDSMLKILSDYVKVQSPLTELLVIMYDEDKYVAADENGDIIFTLMSYDDILLDIILSIMPKMIAVINYEDFENKEILDDIIKIFENRIIFVYTNS